MYTDVVRHFAAIGARLTVTTERRTRWNAAKPYDLNVIRDRIGEVFALTLRGAPPDLCVLQANRAARHLLLHAAGDKGGERFLCGHDERHWFVAAIASRVTTVTEAKRSLLPPALRDLPLSPDDLARRHNAAYKRQGEWFFVPTDRTFNAAQIHHSEPLQRGTRSKPHLVAELVRFGGEPVILCGGHEYSIAEWSEAIKATPALGKRGHQRLQKNPEVYVRGKVRHADHATLTLDGWHRVYMNGELISDRVTFYD